LGLCETGSKVNKCSQNVNQISYYVPAFIFNLFISPKLAATQKENKIKQQLALINT